MSTIGEPDPVSITDIPIFPLNGQGLASVFVLTTPICYYSWSQIRDSGRKFMINGSEQQALVTRLNRIEGQVRGIRRMVQEPRLCIEILQQLAAAEAALNRISLSVFKHHVESCVPEGVAKGEPESRKRLNELVDIFDRFSK